MIKIKDYLKIIGHNLNHSLNDVDYIVLSQGISLIKNKHLKKYKKKIITDIDYFIYLR